jgi:hypothetical protein
MTSMAGKTVLVIGQFCPFSIRFVTLIIRCANRRIGLQLVRSFIEKKENVIGSVRPETKKSGDPSIADVRLLVLQMV